jgi:hypothetical protein
LWELDARRASQAVDRLADSPGVEHVKPTADFVCGRERFAGPQAPGDLDEKPLTARQDVGGTATGAP